MVYAIYIHKEEDVKLPYIYTLHERRMTVCAGKKKRDDTEFSVKIFLESNKINYNKTALLSFQLQGREDVES